MDQSLSDFNTMHGESTDSNIFSLPLGALIGDYEIVDTIGKGGMGEVYRVKQVNLGSEFAMKILLPEAVSNTTLLSRFQVEARVMASLSHKNIVRVHYLGDHKNMPYMIMDLIQTKRGRPYSLEEVVNERKKLPEDEVSILLSQVCNALSYLHSYNDGGIIHRDLKPANLLLNSNGHILVTDFGLVKVNDQALKNQIADFYCDDAFNLKSPQGGSSSIELTAQGATLGTFDYMAPELRNNAACATVQTDIYAIGIILYKMLTGRMPIGRFKDVSEYGCSAAWNQLVNACLESETSDRPQSIEEVVKLHSQVVSKKEKNIVKLSPPKNNNQTKGAGKAATKPPSKKNSKPLILTVLSALIIILSTALFFVDEKQTEDQKINSALLAKQEGESIDIKNFDTDIQIPTNQLKSKLDNPISLDVDNSSNSLTKESNSEGQLLLGFDNADSKITKDDSKSIDSKGIDDLKNAMANFDSDSPLENDDFADLNSDKSLDSDDKLESSSLNDAFSDFNSAESIKEELAREEAKVIAELEAKRKQQQALEEAQRKREEQERLLRLQEQLEKAQKSIAAWEKELNSKNATLAQLLSDKTNFESKRDNFHSLANENASKQLAEEWPSKEVYYTKSFKPIKMGDRISIYSRGIKFSGKFGGLSRGYIKIGLRKVFAKDHPEISRRASPTALASHLNSKKKALLRALEEEALSEIKASKEYMENTKNISFNASELKQTKNTIAQLTTSIRNAQTIINKNNF